jgi:multiple sugar transport system ATP-binding protein
MPAFAVENLSVAFGAGRNTRVALDRVSFKVGAGELLVILGPTGAGKTTLLRALAGLQKPQGGKIFEEGASGAGGAEGRTDISLLPPHRRDAAMVFQNFSLYPRMTVYGNLAFPLRPKALGLAQTEIDARVAQAAGLLGLTDKLERKPNELSGGELQRVAIGRALVRRPKLFLLDEPLANLDAKLRERMTVEIHRLQRALGAAMVYVTHDHVEAMSLADRILVLAGGRVLQAGHPEDIYRHPVDSQVAGMLGHPAINLFGAAEAARLGLPDSGGKLSAIRPESWRVTPDVAGPAKVTVVEHLGARTALLLDVQGIGLRTVVAPSLRVKAGDRLRLSVDPSEILHLDR